MLDAPSTQNLRRRFGMRASDFGQDGMIHGLAVPKGSVRLEHHTLGLEVVNGILTVEEGVDFNLIHGRFGTAGVDKFFAILHGVVGYTHIAYFAFLLEGFKCFVGLNVFSGYGPVDQVEIDVIRAEIGKCLVQLSANRLISLLNSRRPNLAAQEQFLPLHPTRLNGLTNLGLVPVEFSTLQKSVSDIEGISDAFFRGALGTGLSTPRCHGRGGRRRDESHLVRAKPYGRMGRPIS
mmetsp:Transcript_32992/g.69509  ORF Transcript_32992/g.69509 Transcript_32992/m.69509 type:complete len:235 (-) Transcript_32992:290-994(-)